MSGADWWHGVDADADGDAIDATIVRSKQQKIIFDRFFRVCLQVNRDADTGRRDRKNPTQMIFFNDERKCLGVKEKDSFPKL